MTDIFQKLEKLHARSLSKTKAAQDEKRAIFCAIQNNEPKLAELLTSIYQVFGRTAAFGYRRAGVKQYDSGGWAEKKNFTIKKSASSYRFKQGTK